MPEPDLPAIADLRVALAGCMRLDRLRLGKRLSRLSPGRERDHARLRRLAADVERAVARRAGRAGALPVPVFPEELPVSVERERIAETIAAHQVVVVCGETGSGKTTQLPKICLALGRGVDGYIGHTQPRRIAARTVAARIAAELDSPPGRLAGYKVRFEDRVDEAAYIKLMTDGLLLAEITDDRWLDAYDTLIIDEAHERSLNIDLLLGYLKQVLPRRPDLKLILSSASIDTERFSRHFDGAPVIEVSGRTWPVSLRWRPEAGGGPQAPLPARVRDGVSEALAAGDGDVLVFLPGERDIRDCAALLRRTLPPGTELLPLYARLAAARQDVVFAPHTGRRVVLATNVAETSITVPGVRYVVDTGLARIGRWSHRSRVQRLPVEPVSKASAEQRKGRCGRVGPGVCIRLYDEQEYAARPDYTDPEIVRADLAGVILQMKSLGLGDVEQFPFMDPPDPRAAGDGYRLLTELGALDARRAITPLGRKLARYPVDPRLARMVLAGAERGALDETLVIAAALSVQDPRERPSEAREQARSAQAVFHDGRSDFLGTVKLWNACTEQIRELTRREFEGWCRERCLSVARIREWRQVHRQLVDVASAQGLRRNGQPAAPAAVHRALLSGLLDLVGERTSEDDYRGLRGRRFRVSPGSALAKAGPRWVMAAELVETARVYAHTVAAVKAPWIEAAAGTNVRREWLETAFDPASGEVIGWQRVVFGGLVLAARRRGWFGRENPAEARETFIQAALVDGELPDPPAWLRHNRDALQTLHERAARARRSIDGADAQSLSDHYQRELPADVHDAAGLRRWLAADEHAAARLWLEPAALAGRSDLPSLEDFPDRLELDGLQVPLRYRHAPGEADDGITATIPLAMLNQLDPAGFEWLVPGLRPEKVATLLRCLPRHERREFVPAPEYAAAFVAAHPRARGSLVTALAQWLEQRAGRKLDVEALRAAAHGADQRLPAWLRMRFELRDSDGSVVDTGRDLAALQARHAGRASERFDSLRAGLQVEQERATDWSFGELPGQMEVTQGEARLRGFPALVDLGDAVAVRVLDDAAAAARSHRAGLLRLFRLRVPRDSRQALRRPPEHERLALLYSLLPMPPRWFAPLLPEGAAEREPAMSLAQVVLQRVFLEPEADIRDAATFSARLEAGSVKLWPLLRDTAALLLQCLQAHADCLGERRAVAREHDDPRFADLDEQLACLVPRGFLELTPPEQLSELPRYLAAAALRARRMAGAAGRDHDRTQGLRPLVGRWRDAVAHCLSRGEPLPPALARYRWLLEEYRVSLFAQELGTAEPVSAQRLERQWLAVQEAMREPVKKS